MKLTIYSLLCASAAVLPARADVVVENEMFRLTLDDAACAKSLLVKSTGEEMLASEERVPFFSTVQARPYVNEIKLAFMNKETEYAANRLRREGDLLVVGFERVPYEARVKIVVKPRYLAFLFSGFTVPAGSPYRFLKMDAPPVERFCMARLPLRRRANFGDWLNTVWDERNAAALLGVSPESLAEQDIRPWGECLRIESHRRIGFKGTGAALVAAPTSGLMDAVADIESDFGLPPGVEGRRKGPLNHAIARVFDLTPQTVDEHIRWAKKGGFKYMQVYYSCVSKEKYWWPSWWRIGDYDYREEYPEGKKDLVKMLAKLRAAGIVPGLHILHTHIGLESRYVTPVADRRLNLKERFTLAAPLGTDDTEITVDENTCTAPRAKGCRTLRFGGELMTYEAVTDERPYRFLGVRRGAYATTVTAHPAGEIGGVLDVSEFGTPGSCYIDQTTDLQDEIADKIADIYSAGFGFVYFDGAEGVNPPFNYHVGNAQYRIWRKLDPKPLFTEGAAKTHFGWHMLTGANAFDAFMPEVFKERIAEHPAAEAPLMRRNFTRVNFGWWHYHFPGKNTVGVQPDIWEYGTSRAAAWDCPATVCIPQVSKIAEHPRADDLFETLRRWEDVRSRRLLTAAQKETLKDLSREHHLFLNGKGEYELVEWTQLDVAGGRWTDVRAFSFVRGGKMHVAYWHVRGAGRLVLPNGVSLPADKMRYWTGDLDYPSVRRLFSKAKIEPSCSERKE